MSTSVGQHGGAGPLSLMSCVRESSPLQDYEHEVEKNVVTKRKFWNPKKWFRKKQKTGDSEPTLHQQETRDVDGSRSRSTGELSTDEEPPDVRNSSSMHPGLSVSHDSVFHPLNSASSDLELDGAQSSSSLSISQPLCDAKLQTELSSRLRLRRGRGDTSEDDEGLPRSPLCGSPAANTDSYLIIEKTGHNKDLPTKSHSTCSDGSLLSMDSSEMDEDLVGFQSRHSSRISLNEKQDHDLELLGPHFSTTPLNHSAAHHRVSVRPKRTYGAPRRKKGQLSTALPATPEVNEDSSIRSISPESVNTEPISELRQTRTPTLVSFKCNSLPAGVTPPTSDSFRLSRSKSNAGKSQDCLMEEKPSLFERLFPRRSAKKKKKEVEVDGREDKKNKPVVAPRTGAAARQRVQPIEIPTKEPRPLNLISPLSPDKSFSPSTSPIQLELEHLLKQRHISLNTPPQSPKSPQKPPEATNEDLRTKIKLTGLSSLQQRVLIEYSEPDFKPQKCLVKSHSFKSKAEPSEDIVTKAASLDSVKNLEEPPVLKSELQLTLKTPARPKSPTRISITSSKPEFAQKQLNRVELRPTSNVVLVKSPKMEEEKVRPKSVFTFPPSDLGVKPQLPRKFSKEDVEIIEKEERRSSGGTSGSGGNTPTTPTNQTRFKKNDSKPSSRKSSIISTSEESLRERALKTRSISLDSLKSESKIDLNSSQDSFDKKPATEVVMRRKSFAKKTDEEPELMKVFARRSLKLKDSEVDQLQEQIKEQSQSDKENHSEVEENKVKEEREVKQPLMEIKKEVKNAKEEDVQLRRSINSNIFLATQRATSLQTSKVVTDFHIKKQASLNERRRTDQWITVKKEDSIEEKKHEEVITHEEIRTETKNFSQRRAEWEKRVQQAQK